MSQTMSFSGVLSQQSSLRLPLRTLFSTSEGTDCKDHTSGDSADLTAGARLYLCQATVIPAKNGARAELPELACHISACVLSPRIALPGTDMHD